MVAEHGAMAVAEITLNDLVQCVKHMADSIATMTENQQNDNSMRTFGSWEHTDKYKNVKIFGGAQGEWEEFSQKLLSQMAAGNYKVVRVMKDAEKMTEADLEAED